MSPFMVKLKPVLLFLNRHIVELLAYIGIRAFLTFAVISIVSLVLLIAPGELFPLMALIPPVAFMLFRPLLRRREWRMMSTYLDGAIRPFPAAGKPWRSWWIRAMETLRLHCDQPREAPDLRRRILAWRLKRIGVETLVLLPFLAVGIVVAWGTAWPVFLYAVLTALIVGWGFAAGGMAPVFALLLVDQVCPQREGTSVIKQSL